MRLCRFLAIFLFCVLMVERPAHAAYLDPGTGSMFLQIILGGLAGLAIALKLFWRRLLSMVGLGQKEDSKEKAPQSYSTPPAGEPQQHSGSE